MTSSLPESSSELLKWEPLVLTEDKIRWLWDQMQQFPQLWDDFNRNDFDTFVAKLMYARNIFVDIGPGIGIAAGMGVKPGLDMVIHLVMFDRRLRGREPTFLAILHEFVSLLKLQRVTAIIPQDCTLAIRLVKRLGFTEEGMLKNATIRDGKLLNVYVFGLLKDELDAKVSARASGSPASTAA